MRKNDIKYNRGINGLAGSAMIFVIRLYKATFSFWLGRQCKYIPTCSEYAIEAIEIYGPYKGFAMSVRRILRCNPFSKGGFDYPDKNE